MARSALQADAHWKLKTEQQILFRPLRGSVLSLLAHAGIVAGGLVLARLCEVTHTASTAHDVTVEMVYEAASTVAPAKAAQLPVPPPLPAPAPRSTPLLKTPPAKRQPPARPRSRPVQQMSGPDAAPAPGSKPIVAPTATTTSPASQGSDALQAYAREVWMLIEKTKPDDNAVPGTVLVKIVIAPNGVLLSVSISQGSGDDELDQQALSAADDAAPFPPPPDGATLNQRTFIVPFNFQ